MVHAVPSFPYLPGGAEHVALGHDFRLDGKEK